MPWWIITTQHLVLRPFAPQDAPDLSALLLNEEIKKTYMIPDFADAAALQKMVGAFMTLSRAAQRFVRGIYLQNRLIGFVNDVEITGGTMELGYVIHPALWGRGYASEMLEAVLHALLGRDFDCIRAGAFQENAASLRVMEKCGMQRCARTDSIEYRGQTHLCIYYEARQPSAFLSNREDLQ